MYNNVQMLRSTIQQPFSTDIAAATAAADSTSTTATTTDVKVGAPPHVENKKLKVYLLNKQVSEEKVLMRDQYCFALEVALRAKVDHIVLMVPPERHQTITMHYLCDALHNYCRVASTRKAQLHMLVDHFVMSSVYNILASGVADVNRQFYRANGTGVRATAAAIPSSLVQQTHLQAILQRAAMTTVVGSSPKKHHCSCCVAAHKRKCKKKKHKTWAWENGMPFTTDHD